MTAELTATGAVYPIIVRHGKKSHMQSDTIYDYPEKRRFTDAVGRLFVFYEKKFRVVETDKKGEEYIVY